MQRAEMSVSLLSIKTLRNLQGLGQFIQAKYRISDVTDLKEHKHTRLVNQNLCSLDVLLE